MNSKVPFLLLSIWYFACLSTFLKERNWIKKKNQILVGKFCFLSLVRLDFFWFSIVPFFLSFQFSIFSAFTSFSVSSFHSSLLGLLQEMIFVWNNKLFSPNPFFRKPQTRNPNEEKNLPSFFESALQQKDLAQLEERELEKALRASQKLSIRRTKKNSRLLSPSFNNQKNKKKIKSNFFCTLEDRSWTRSITFKWNKMKMKNEKITFHKKKKGKRPGIWEFTKILKKRTTDKGLKQIFIFFNYCTLPFFRKYSQ